MTNLDITSCYVWDSQVDKIYLGTDIVWQKQSPGPGLPYSAQPFTIEVVDTTDGSDINFFKIVPTATSQTVASRAPNVELYYTINQPFTDISTWTVDDNPWKSNGQYVVNVLQSNGSITGLSSGDTVRFYTFVGDPDNEVLHYYPEIFNGAFAASGYSSANQPPNNVATNSFGHSTVGCIVYGNILSLICSEWVDKTSTGGTSGISMFYDLAWARGTGLTTSRNIFLGLFCTSGASTNKMNLYDAQNLVLPQDVRPGCYFRLFSRTKITNSPKLPATTLAANCYGYIYAGCKQITESPVLPAGELTGTTNAGCYANMFYGCSNLTGVTCLATSRDDSAKTSGWLYGVAASGTFYKNPNATFWGSGTSEIPSGWTVQNYTSS